MKGALVPPFKEFLYPILVFTFTNKVDDAIIKCSVIEKAVNFRPLIPRTDCKASLNYDSQNIYD